MKGVKRLTQPYQRSNILRELRKRVFPYAVRVLHSNAKRIAAVDEYIGAGRRS
jgi:hypothetical protein